MKWKYLIGGFLLVVVAVGAALASRSTLNAADLWKAIQTAARPGSSGQGVSLISNDTHDEQPLEPWDGLVRLTPQQVLALGVEVTKVRPQTESVRLEVNGTTAYDPGTLTQVRTRFPSLVTRVHVKLGDIVHKGDPLVDLDSTDLAEAKSVFEERIAQHEHDAQQLTRLTKLHDQKAVSDKVYLDAVNEENQSRLELKRARDKLEIYGLTPEQIERVPTEDGTQMARMTLHAPTDGLVIDRQVVQDNLYDMSSVLMTIAPLDALWVKGNVYESDVSKVHLGQTWEIRFPFQPDKVIQAKIEQIDAKVDPETKTVRIRTTIKNPDGRLKSDMLVRGAVLIPPVEGRTVIPRIAEVVADTDAYAFVRVGTDPDRFRRRKIVIDQEGHEEVIVASGLKPGEEVATRGSLILSQMDDDLRLTRPSNAPDAD